MDFWTGIFCTSYQKELFAKATKPVHYKYLSVSPEKPGRIFYVCTPKVLKKCILQIDRLF